MGKIHRDWYYRLIIQMKDDRVKISIYDDGNAFWAGSYSRYANVPSIFKNILFCDPYIQKEWGGI